MSKGLVFRELNTVDEMLTTFPVLVFEYPSMTKEAYEKMLHEMAPANYAQVGAFENDICLGVSGYWVNTKLWCGRYLELDNIVVSETERSRGIGKMLMEFLSEVAEKRECNMLALDSYTTNFKAHKLFYNLGFVPRGFHFIKFLSDSDTDANGYRVK